MNENYFFLILKFIFDVFFGFINIIFNIELVPGIYFGPVAVVIVICLFLIFFIIRRWTDWLESRGFYV